VSRSVQATPASAFETRRRDRHLKVDAVLRTAVQLFLEVGYHRATLDQVAQRLAITKPAIYNYFRSKEAILYACFSRAVEAVNARTVDTEPTARNGREQLRFFLGAYAEVMLTDFGLCLAIVEDRELTPRWREKIVSEKRQIDRRFRAAIERGVADGSIRANNAKLAALFLAGAVNSCARWFRPGGKFSRELVVEELVTRLLDGL
jgi:AcrR family transcriptional regulator